jgi:hypothetical protein
MADSQKLSELAEGHFAKTDNQKSPLQGGERASNGTIVQMEQMEEILALLHEVIGMLEDRLRHALVPVYDEEKRGPDVSAPRDPGLSPITEGMEEFNHRLYSARMRINDIRDRINL